MLPRRRQSRPPQRRMFVAFVFDGESRILPAGVVAAVRELGVVAPLPTADPHRLGLTVHEGRVVAVLGAAGAERREVLEGASHLVLLRRGEGSVGLAVEALVGLKVTYGDELPEGFHLLEHVPGLGTPHLGAAGAEEGS